MKKISQSFVSSVSSTLSKSLSLAVTLVAAMTLTSFEAQADVLKFKMDEGRVITAEYQKVKGATETLVLLPGINRSLETLSETRFFEAAKKYKLNVLTIATSSHPRSIQALSKSETPYFQSHTMTLDDYAAEIELVVEQLELQKPFVSSLSYSSAILNQLDPKKFAGIIEMVPMGDPVEGADDLTKSGRDYQDFLMLNPFMIGFVRAQRDAAYTKTWTASVEERLDGDPNFYGKNPRKADIIEGYVSLVRAAENFRLNRASISAKKHFILVDQELEERFNLQLTAAQAENRQNNGASSLLIVAEANHVLPSSQPESTVKAVTLIIDMVRENKFESGVVAGETFVEFTPAQKKELGLK